MLKWNRYATIWLVISITLTLIGVANPIFVLNENQILYYFSAAAQVIAAIYGLTVTGYIFFRNELDRKSSDDESLEEITSYLKSNYHSEIKYISISAMLSIVLSLCVILSEFYSIRGIVIASINFASSLVVIVLAMVANFVINILNPNSFEEISKKIKTETDYGGSNEKGSLEEFLKHYNAIEDILEKYGNAISNERIQTTFDPTAIKYKRTIAKAQLVRILYQAEKIHEDLRDRLIKLISFRNALIHGRELNVTKGDIDGISAIHEDLNQALNTRQLLNDGKA